MIFEEKVLLLSMAFLGFLFSRIPYAGIFFRTLNTLFHELGHALAAYLTSGKVLRIDLFSDTSGSTITQSGNKREQMFIALSGYFFTSFVFLLFLLLIRWQWEYVLNLLIVASFIVSLLFYVKNTFGVIWLISMLGAYFSLYYWVPQYSWMVVYVFTGVLWWESVYSSFIIFILSVRIGDNAGDAGNLSKLSSIPSPFWGTLFIAQSLFFSYIAYQWILS